jgi:hypothetical protein
MKIAKICSALALAGLASSSYAVNLVSEGFDDITSLSGNGWVLANVSSPSAGTPWFQGDNTTAFTAQSGADNSYIASNFTAAPPGGFIDNFLITPYFSLASDVTLTFYARADVIDGFSDTFALLAGTTTLGSSEVVTELIHPTVATGGDWTMYTVTLAGQGGGAVGRFAFEYFGDADTSNYIGLDTVTVAVPEPETYALMALGLAALALRRRKAA